MDGFLNLDKPAGWTSHDCVAKVRRLLRLKKVGHGGTLDPAATGVLPIALGRATRLLQFLASEKAYRATLRFGLRTTTDDLEGEVVAQQSAHHLSRDQVVAVLPQFEGVIQQIPPKYSAVQVGGKRLYDLARAGVEVDVPVRTVEVYGIEVLDWRPGRPEAEAGGGPWPELDVAIACGSGTYIRAIARDWGEAVGTGAALASLTRTRSSGFDQAHSLTLEALEQAVEAGTFHPLEPAIALAHLPPLTLSAALALRWRQGQRLPLTPEELEIQAVLLDAVAADVAVRVIEEGDRLLGVGLITPSPDGAVLRPQMVLVPA